MTTTNVRPLFKYIGGKTWMRDYLRTTVKTQLFQNPIIDTYCEPFVGGLGAFLSVYDVLINHNIKHVILNDINSKIISLYQQVSNNPARLLNDYMTLENAFSAAIPNSARARNKKTEQALLKQDLKAAEAYFKKIRAAFNTTQSKEDCAAHFLFLQSHCFNGVYRENSKGEYNTPFNWEPKTFTRNKIEEKIKGLQTVFSKFNITFESKSFELLQLNTHTLYYLDPPYINEALVENKYNKDVFSANKQLQLIKKIDGVPFIYSNHDHVLLIDEFNKHSKPFTVQRIPRKNIISASANSRKQDKTEILVSSTTNQK